MSISAIHPLRVLVLVSILVVGVTAPVAASSITIVGGFEEQIDLACIPCRPATLAGIPVGTLGYTAQDCPAGSGGVTAMSLVLDQASLVRFRFIGLDTDWHNQFYVDQDGDNDPFNDPIVFDLPTRTDEPNPQRAPFEVYLPSGMIHFGYRYNVDKGDFRVISYPSMTFNIFASCMPAANDPNPRTCTQGYIAFADGAVQYANDDHQDLGLQFEVVPEPGSFALTGIGLLVLAALVRRRRT